MPGFGVFANGVNSFFLSGELAILGGTFEVLAGIFQELPEGLLGISKKIIHGKNCAHDFF